MVNWHYLYTVSRRFCHYLHVSKPIHSVQSEMVGYTKAKTHGFSMLQINANSFKAFRKLLNEALSPLVIAIQANNLRMFYLQSQMRAQGQLKY